jgi:hypothetical protein
VHQLLPLCLSSNNLLLFCYCTKLPLLLSILLPLPPLPLLLLLGCCWGVPLRCPSAAAAAGCPTLAVHPPAGGCAS